MIRSMVLAAALVAGTTAVDAATLDFTELGGGTIAGSNASITGADLTSGSTGLFVGANFTNSICALNVAAFNCANDLTIDFTDLVSNITFDVGGFEGGDFIQVLAFGVGNVLLGTVDILAAGFYDLSVFNNVDYLYFDDSSIAAGVDYGNVSYDVAAIPVPASLPLLIAGLGGLMALRRRRRT